MKLFYSHERPTKEGRYFLRFTEFSSKGKKVLRWVKVRYVAYVNWNGFDGWRVMTDSPMEHGTPLKWFAVKNFEWAGPIPEPK